MRGHHAGFVGNTELVEGFVTRLVAIYQSQDPPTIGGVRSARLADRSFTAMVRGALVYSGTSDYAWSLISKDADQGKYVELSADHAQGYFRVNFRAGAQLRTVLWPVNLT